MVDVKQGFYETKTPETDGTLDRLSRDVIGSKEDSASVAISATDSVISYVKGLVTMVGAIQFRVDKSASNPAEEDGMLGFVIGVFDVDGGAIDAADIDITSIIQTMEQRTGGAAFDVDGITQPPFAKAAGPVADDYRFLAAEWTSGDIYKLSVSGITATVNGQTVYLPTMVWSNMIFEASEMKLDIDDIDTNVGQLTALTMVAPAGRPATVTVGRALSPAAAFIRSSS